ncbi:MAG: single-stranded-DNA-specific exonuclease RecJ [Actinobacteria bacterium]|nr:single-stranded-DNA-specific exonuclease RecJ [Actinomycetota bacterium]
MRDGRWTITDLDLRHAASLAGELGVSEVTAAVLVRRGLDTPEVARSFLAAASPEHDPKLLGDMEAAVATIRKAVDEGTRICVHGDYDVDGICATALAVKILAAAGAEVEWLLPSRFEEGYGLAADTVERVAASGVGLLLTVDCGITAVEEVAQARALGLDVVVTDHHRPGETLPECPVVSTRPTAYPFPELCGTGVVYKLGQALLGPEHPVLAHNLDLVGLATIADVVPLVDENRALAAAGLRVLARTGKPGLQALMRSAQVDPAAVDATAVGFRLAPRINAAGRLGRPDVALQLILTEDPAEATRLAAELESLNRERQTVEERILREAIALVEAWPESKRRRRGYVLWGEDWHEGVIGIVASRLVERFNRPVVLIARGSQGWKGSGRSIARFDLHGALAACSDHLRRFGGHRAAAGLAIDAQSLEPFAEAFAAHAEGVLVESDLTAEVAVDAVVPASALTLELARQLELLAPFGLGNPDVTLLVAAVETADATTVGEGKHLRFRIRQHGRDAGSAIAFGLGRELDRLRRDERYDVAFRLKENRWNGASSPQLVVRRLFDTAEAYELLRARLLRQWRAGEAAWTSQERRIFGELALGEAGSPRQLLESPTFRELLEEQAEAVLAAAA